jgi:hypothetical protein
LDRIAVLIRAIEQSCVSFLGPLDENARIKQA